VEVVELSEVWLKSNSPRKTRTLAGKEKSFFESFLLAIGLHSISPENMWWTIIKLCYLFKVIYG